MRWFAVLGALLICLLAPVGVPAGEDTGSLPICAVCGKPITEDGARLQIRKLGQFREQGHDPAVVIENSIAGGWQGLFAPKGAPQPPARQAGKHAGFNNLNYREGVSADGSLA